MYRKRKHRRTRQQIQSGDQLHQNYKFIGGAHIHGQRNIVPISLRMRALEYIDESEWNVMRTQGLSDFAVDLLMYAVTGCLPTLRLAVVRATTKSRLFELLKKEAMRLKKHFPNRLQGLASDLSNLEQVVVQLGFPQHLMIHSAPKAEASNERAREMMPVLMDGTPISHSKPKQNMRPESSPMGDTDTTPPRAICGGSGRRRRSQRGQKGRAARESSSEDSAMDALFASGDDEPEVAKSSRANPSAPLAPPPSLVGMPPISEQIEKQNVDMDKVLQQLG